MFIPCFEQLGQLNHFDQAWNGMARYRDALLNLLMFLAANYYIPSCRYFWSCTHLFLLDLLFHIRFVNVVHLNVVREVLLVLEHAAAGLAGKNLSVPVALFVPLPQLDRIEHDVAKGASVVLPLLGIEMRHSVFSKLRKICNQ